MPLFFSTKTFNKRNPNGLKSFMASVAIFMAISRVPSIGTKILNKLIPANWIFALVFFIAIATALPAASTALLFGIKSVNKLYPSLLK